MIQLQVGEQSTRWFRSATLADVWELTRLDGVVIRFTNHDRQLSWRGGTFTPIAFGAAFDASSDAGLKVSTQEISGYIDGTTLTIPDMLAGRYKGARVRHRVVDWRFPGPMLYADTKWIRQIRWDGEKWQATLDNVAAKIQRPVGGRFGGVFAPTCHYRLGDANCKKDISSMSGTMGVAAIDHQRMVFTASMGGSWPDDHWGEVEWTSGANTGVVSKVVTFEATPTNRFHLLTPTPFDMAVSDGATIRPACDGLLATCINVFSNQDNFGGAPYEPGSAHVLEPPTTDTAP